MVRRVPLLRRLGQLDPPIEDPSDALAENRVSVDGAIVTNPNSQVLPDARIVVKPRTELRGVQKLGPALDTFEVEVDGRVAVDLGACTGGFTQVLLAKGAARVFAVDVGFGQLLGSLRQDDRVVNLERTNIAAVTPELLGCRPDIVVCDITKLSLREVAKQLVDNDVPKPGTQIVGLVKPMFELGTGELPEGEELDRALRLAENGIEQLGWTDLASIDSSIQGHRGAVEFFIHARWPTSAEPSPN